MGHWTSARHFLFHAGVLGYVRVVTLCGNRVRDQRNVPTELWQLIYFFLRSDWAAPIAEQSKCHVVLLPCTLAVQADE